MYIHGTRDKATQSKRKPSLNIETELSIKEEKAKERVKSQNRIDALLLPTILRSLRGSAYSKDRCSFDSFDSLCCYWGLLNFCLVFV
jgi:hypothetical protein